MISVVIPTYKNKENFLKNLENNYPILSKYQIIIINDNPTISLKKNLANYKNLILLENKKNLGFGASVNLGVGLAKYNYILLLNDDVILDKNNNFAKLIFLFKNNPKLFAVSFAQKERRGKITGKNILYWRSGMIHHREAFDLKEGDNGWAEGGASLIDKDKFLALGGFDDLYYPFYWEDIDLSFRAWKRGYQLVFNPTVLVKHHHETTIGKYFSYDFIKTIAFRNQFIFVWKNITDKKLLFDHFFRLFGNLIYYGIIKKQPYFIFGFLKGLLLIPKIFKRKNYEKKYFMVKDEEILNKFNQKI
ncbi:MAG: glycosyltransferase family 2 protein [Microgenomates group bacterium]|jgi:GT2 family glycosyltransferase|nr:glycosyltransferase family 2 protein [Microgenomates group bacterium]